MRAYKKRHRERANREEETFPAAAAAAAHVRERERRTRFNRFYSTASPRPTFFLSLPHLSTHTRASETLHVNGCRAGVEPPRVSEQKQRQLHLDRRTSVVVYLSYIQSLASFLMSTNRRARALSRRGTSRICNASTHRVLFTAQMFGLIARASCFVITFRVLKAHQSAQSVLGNT